VRRLPYYGLGPYLALDAVYLAEFNCTISNLYDKRDAIITLVVSIVIVCPARADWYGSRFNSRVFFFFINELLSSSCFIQIQLFIIYFILQNETEHVCNVAVVFGIHRVGLRPNRYQWVSNSNTNIIRL